MDRLMKGDALMIFFGSNYESVLYARSHSMDISASTQNTQYRYITDPMTAFPTAKSAIWSMSAEFIVTDYEFHNLIDLSLSHEKIIVLFGKAENYDGTPNTEWQAGYGYRGKAYITNVEVSAPTNDAAVMTIELQGTTPLTYSHYSDPWDSSTEWSPSKTDPDIEFEHASDEVSISQDNIYQISDLLNPQELSVRFIVLPFQGRVLKDVSLIEQRDISSSSEVITDIMLSALKPGVYTVIAIFDGDDTYNPAQAEYIITILDDGQAPSIRPAEPIDQPQDSQKYDPVFYFEYQSQSREQNMQNKYKVQMPINPANLPVSWTLPQGVTMDSSNYLIINNLGDYVITCSTAGNDIYNAATATYTLTIGDADVDEKQYIQLRWINPQSVYGVNQSGEYEMPALYNPSNVPVTITCSNQQVTVSGNTIYAPDDAVFTITVSYAGSSFYYPASDSFTARIVPKQAPVLYWSDANVSIEEAPTHEYTLPQLVNPYNVPVTVTTMTQGTVIQNGILYYNGTGTLTIQAVFAGSDTFTPAVATLTYTISEHIKVTPPLYWPVNPVVKIYEPDASFEANKEQYETSYSIYNPQSLTVSYTEYMWYNSQYNAYVIGSSFSLPHNYPPSYYNEATQSYMHSYIRALYNGSWDYDSYMTDLVFEVSKADPAIEFDTSHNNIPPNSASGTLNPLPEAYMENGVKYIIPYYETGSEFMVLVNKPADISYQDIQFEIHTKSPADTFATRYCYAGAPTGPMVYPDPREDFEEYCNEFGYVSYYWSDNMKPRKTNPLAYNFNYSYDLRLYNPSNYYIRKEVLYIWENNEIVGVDETKFKMLLSFDNKPYFETNGLSYIVAKFNGNSYYNSYDTRLDVWEYYRETANQHYGFAYTTGSPWDNPDVIITNISRGGRKSLQALVPRTQDGIYNLASFGYYWSEPHYLQIQMEEPMNVQHFNEISYSTTNCTVESFKAANLWYDNEIIVRIPNDVTSCYLYAWHAEEWFPEYKTFISHTNFSSADGYQQNVPYEKLVTRTLNIKIVD